MLIELVDHRIGKMFPSLASMGCGLPISDVRQLFKKPRLLPNFKIAMHRRLNAKVGLQFFKNILQRWRQLCLGGRKAEPMRLPRPMIGVLTQNHNFNQMERVSEKA